MPTLILEPGQVEQWIDEQVIERVVGGDTAAFEIVMRRYNQRLYRVARAILGEDHEAEDVMQDAYLRAYGRLAQFVGRARFSTWLTRLVVHQALARKRRRRVEGLGGVTGLSGELLMPASTTLAPEYGASTSDLHRLLQEAILALPEDYRTVLVLRDVEEMSAAEAASALEITEANAKMRLHRARALLRKELYARTRATTTAAFQFPAARCDRVVANVLARLPQL